MSTTLLAIPAQSQVKIEPTAKTPLSDGFNYPQFRLLNKQARITISKGYEVETSTKTKYHLLSIANKRGWFAAARYNGSSYEIVCSPLSDLKSSIIDTKDSEDNFTPKRTVPLQGKPNILAFANQEATLVVGLEQGSALAFDSTALFIPGDSVVQPANQVQLQSEPLRQILPNPGTEANLVDRIAIVGNGTTQIFNSKLEPQGGWTASDATTNPMAVAWSPKGKHIAVGLHSGDILTFALTNMSTPHKHIPATFQGVLSSLSWTGPGHTFRTSYYKSEAPEETALHIVSLHTKTPTGVYYSLNPPFPSGDRFQSPYTVQFPKWDEDSGVADHSKSLLVYGDANAVDIEVLAHEGQSWYQQSQENPVSLPLNKEATDDTMMLSLDVDLTDAASSTPIVYVYLNDGTIQGWYMSHSKPYLLMVTGGLLVPQPIQSDSSMSTESPIKSSNPPFGSSTPATGFGQSMSTEPTKAVSTFGTSAPTFGQSSLGASSTFGQPSLGQSSAFGSGGFGQPSAPRNTGSGFAGFSGTPSAFGSQNNAKTTGAFGSQKNNSPAPASGFGAFAGGSSSFSAGPSNASASDSFGNSSTTNVFAQGSFSGTNTSSATPSGFGGTTGTDMTREASMADDTPGFGGLSLRSTTPNTDQSKPSGGIFGSVATSPATTSAFENPGGSLLKPATGFGAFTSNPDSPFNKPSIPSAPIAFGAGSNATPLANPAFGKPGLGGATFGQSGFGTSGFGQSGFSQTPFGQPSLGATSAPSTSGGGFSAFASKPASLTGEAKSGRSVTPFGSAAGGSAFSAFVGQAASLSSPVKQEEHSLSAFGSTAGGFSSLSGRPSSFTSATKEEPVDRSMLSTPVKEEPNASPFTTGTSTFGGALISPPFGNKATTSPFGSTTPSTMFGNTQVQAPEQKPPTKQTPVGLSSPPSSPEPMASSGPNASDGEESPPQKLVFTSTQPPVRTGAFGNLQTSPSAFRPATGFGAFGGSTPSSSPFFNKDDKTPPVSAFGIPGTPTKSPSAFPIASPSAKTTTTPTFGAASALGSKSVFGQATPPSPSPAATKAPTSAFSAFSSSSNAFSAFAGNKKSFSEMLKTGGDESKDPTKIPGPKEEVKKEEAGDKPEPTKTESADEKPSTSSTEEAKAQVKSSPSPTPALPVKDEVKKGSPSSRPLETSSTEVLAGDASFGDISSAGSSFVDIKAETTGKEQGDHEEDDDRSDDYESDEYDREGSDYVPSSEHESEDDGSEGELEQVDLSPPGSPSKSQAKDFSSGRSLSPTPQAEVPDIRVTPSPSTEGLGRKEREASPTPTGTPEEGPTPRRSPSPSPISAASSTPFNLGLGRPSTRPARSSPLAGTPLSSDDSEDDDDEDKDKTAVPSLLPLQKTTSKGKSPEEPSKRPKTPPLLSAFGPTTPISMPATPFLAPATPPVRPAMAGTSAENKAPSISGFGQVPKLPAAATSNFFAAPPPSGLFGAPLPNSASEPAPVFSPAAPTSKASATPFNLPSFAISSFSSTPSGPESLFGAPATPSTSIFGKPPFNLAPQAQPPMSMPSPGMFGKGSFDIAPQTPPSISTFRPAQPTTSSGFPQSAAPVAKPVKQEPPLPELSMEEGMQRECATLILEMEKKLNELHDKARDVNKKREELSKSAGGSWHKVDLGDSKKWGLSDAKQFGQVMVKFGEDLEGLEEQRGQARQNVHRINGAMLKALTSREEVDKFKKAQTDPSVTHMIKTRRLGPEHSEARLNLRRTIATAHDRVGKLESRLQEVKKKLAQANSGKVSIKAPTLDVVNRTFRNIELAIIQQADDVSQLAARIAKLDLAEKPSAPMTPTRDARLPDPIRRKPYNVTPNVAAVTAAALNAERAAHVLKKALLASRKEPLLNVKVNTTTSPPVAYSTPQKATLNAPPAPASPTHVGFTMQLSGAVFAPVTPETPASTWVLPPDDFSPSPSLPTTRRGATAVKKHTTVQLKRTPGSTPPAAAPSFDWGPLPAFKNPPLTSLAATFAKIDTSKKG